MKIIDVLGKPCPIPVIESKKALAEPDTDNILVKVDHVTAVQNLEKMANGYGYGFSCAEKGKNSFEVSISKNGKAAPESSKPESNAESSKPGSNAEISGLKASHDGTPSGGLVVVISKDAMGEGAEALGKILIKGFLYSLTALPVPPAVVIFLNAGARLTSAGANTIDDIRRLEQKGTEILTCGTCVNYYGLQDKLAVGSITDMYGITEKMAAAGNIINI